MFHDSAPGLRPGPSNKPFGFEEDSEMHRHRQRERQRDGDRETEKQRDRETERRTERERDGEKIIKSPQSATNCVDIKSK